uniref:Large ribosomal subunit protein bL19m n=1 Tax=Dendroctonus ponderosae TaxID=77166 RepID=J3JZ88_DENPD|nr:unknown [Dendroctonus ponderosae]
MFSIISKCRPLTQFSDVSKTLIALSSQSTAVLKEKSLREKDVLKKQILECRHVYPEFLPDPKVEFRNVIREKLERSDMVARRTQIDIGEFYVGSVLAVTSSDRHAPGKTHRFVGICIQREGCGLRASFILRNVVDHQGVEILYHMYDPTIHKVEVLRLEKRLDDKLLYLRDALPEYSTFDLNMDVEILPEGAPIPVNPIKVKLKPRPWLEHWERQNLMGVQDLELPERFYIRAKERETPWEKYDLMKEYMRTIPEEEQLEIFSGVQNELHKLESQRKKMKRKRIFIKPSKLA